MSRDVALCLYWGMRLERTELCNERLLRALLALRTAHPRFAQWFKTGKSLEEALAQPVAFEAKSLLHYSAKTPHEFEQDTGCAIHLWNGLPRPEALHFALNAVSVMKRMTNAMILTFDAGLSIVKEMFSIPEMIALTDELAQIFDADWGIFSTGSLRLRIDERYNPLPLLARMTYFNLDRFQEFPALRHLEVPGMSRLALDSGALVFHLPAPTFALPDEEILTTCSEATRQLRAVLSKT